MGNKEFIGVAWQSCPVLIYGLGSNGQKYRGVWSSLDVALTAMTMVYFFWALEYSICLGSCHRNDDNETARIN
jgi:hypothetical protein